MPKGTSRTKRGTGGSRVKRAKGYASPRNKVGTGGPGVKRRKGYATKR